MSIDCLNISSCTFTKEDHQRVKTSLLTKIKNNNSESLTKLGDYYIRHENDLPNAIKYYTIAVNNGNYKAMSRLGKIYSNQIQDIFPYTYIQCNDKAYKTCIKNTNIDTLHKKLELAHVYNYINKYDSKKIDIYTEILNNKIEKPNNEMLKIIYHNLGYWYFNGHGVTKNMAESMKFYAKATYMNHYESMNRLDMCCYKLKYYKKEDRIKIYVEALNKCDNEAIIILSYILLNNDGKYYIDYMKEISNVDTFCLARHQKIILSNNICTDIVYYMVLDDYRKFILNQSILLN